MKTVEQIAAIRQETLELIGFRRDKKVVEGSSQRIHIMVCAGTGCTSSQSLNLITAFEKELNQHNLTDRVSVVKCGCLGLCAQGPVVIIYPEKCLYKRVALSDVQAIVTEHIMAGRPVAAIYGGKIDDETSDSPISKFFTRQRRLALRNCGLIDPELIDEYIAFDGYAALEKVLFTMTPAEVIAEVEKSGLRGRGGGGFPTGKKWSFAAQTIDSEKYVLTNADEGDPGAFMDRSVLEGDPHSVIEAMAIAGYAIGANRGVVYVRIEYPIALRRLGIAIEQARNYGLLGDDILGSGFAFDIEIRLGAGAFVCGEETALIESIEGKRGMPRPRPPFPAIKGLWNKPSIINNVETYANIPPLLLNGSEWFAEFGVPQSRGTKVFAVGGKIQNTGLVEIPMGTTLREMVFEIGGGIPNGKAFKAAQTGGPSGGCIPAELLDTTMDYESLQAIGSMMGSGGLIIMDEDTCMVDIAKFFLEFTVEESCGKCPPCRIGIKRMLEILERITSGKGQARDIERLEQLASDIKRTSLCGLGQTAPNPVLSTLRYFREEYRQHIENKRCVAKVCKALINFCIIDDLCKKCGLCVRHCAVQAIEGNRQDGYKIDVSKCMKCGVCQKSCKFNAIDKS